MNSVSFQVTFRGDLTTERYPIFLAKWLGKDAINALAVDGKCSRSELHVKLNLWIQACGRNVTQPGETGHPRIQSTAYFYFDAVMIVSYETLRTLSEHLANCSIGLLLCDEGHRLKNSGKLRTTHTSNCLSQILHLDSLTFQALNALDVKRRVILTGTPVQVIFVDLLLLYCADAAQRMISPNTFLC